MKIIISSSRTMKEKPKEGLNLPAFCDRANELILSLKKKSIEELAEVWNVSLNKAELYKKELSITDLEKELSEAVNCYNGVVFSQFRDCINEDDQEYIKNHLRILSAFYGLLEPFDGIRKYRLEMNSKFRIGDKNLVQYWTDDLYKKLDDSFIVNLASEEYGQCIRRHLKDGDTFIDIEFAEIIKGEEKHISTNMKKARGQMVRYMIENRIEDVNDCSKFNWNGYQYRKELSDCNKMVFHRIRD